MRLKLSILMAVLLALAGVFVPQTGYAQTVSLTPSVVPNGIASTSGQQYRQRVNMTMGAGAIGLTVMFTVTAPPELTIVANTLTGVSGTAGVSAIPGAIAGGNSFPVQVTPAAGGGNSVANATVTIEFDVTTPTSFTGIAVGGKVDTVYTVAFATQANQTNRTIAVAKHNDRPVRLISFAAPDSSRGDTTRAGGRFFKLRFAASGLPDISHTGLNGLSAGLITTDTQTDINYTFYLSTDSTLVKRPSTLSPVEFYTLEPTRTPLVGTRQNPRVVPRTFIKENYVATFGATGLDSLNGVISLAGTLDNSVYYVYVLADPGPDRFPNVNGSATAKKRFDPTSLGTLTGGTFLGRSGPLLVRQPPEFVVAGWDYDDDGGDNYSATGVIQVPSDIVRMESSEATNRKDNRNITIDSGRFFGKGDALASLTDTPSGQRPRPVTTVDLLYHAEYLGNPANFQMAVFLSTASGLNVGNLVGAGIDSLQNAIRVPGSDTLKMSQRVYTFNPVQRNSVTNLVSYFVPEGDYYVYYAATDGTYRTVYQVLNDPFIASPTATTISVRHSPIMTVDQFGLDDFSGNGALDVVTGIGVSQMMSDVDGKNLSLGPATRYVNIFWGGTAGMDGFTSVGRNATVDLYYSNTPSFRAVGKSIAYTSGNSDGTDMLADVGTGDTHLIRAGINSTPNGLYDNSYAWDIWSYVSPEGTIPLTGTRYYIYGLLKAGTTQRLMSFTETNFTTSGGSPMSLSFQHPPYLRPIEPAQDITVHVDDPVKVTWHAVDVDNAEGAGLAVNPTGIGRSSPNSRTDSPNIRILLTSADWGEVTTWGSITNAVNGHRFWLVNANDGSRSTEVGLNEGVDSAYVFTGNRLRNNMGVGSSSANLELQTNSGAGGTYYVYMAIDDGRRPGLTGTKPLEFGNRAPLVRAPGRITFTGTVPNNPVTNPRFVVPKQFTAVSKNRITIPLVADSLVAGQTVGAINMLMSIDLADTAYFELVDTNPNVAGIQPFTLGSHSQLSTANVSQAVYTQGGRLRMDFIYEDLTTGLTFFDGKTPFAFLNLRAKTFTGGSAVNASIQIDNSGNRQSTIYQRSPFQNLGAQVPQPINVTVVRRSQVSGTVPLQGRASSADTVTFILRQVGDLAPAVDSLFNLNDLDLVKAGVQVLTTGPTGIYTLNNVPDGLWILTAQVPRHLAGHDTLLVKPGIDMTNVKPTRDGKGVVAVALWAGDAAGYVDSTGSSKPDNVIDAADVNAINAALFKQTGESGYNTFADINRDGIVDVTDRNYATENRTSNSGSAGFIKPVFPTFKQVVPEGTNADAVVSLIGVNAEQLRVGEFFDVTVKVEGAVAVRAYEVRLDYDPSKLEPMEFTSNGSLFEYYASSIAGSMIDKGKYGFVNSIFGRTPYGASGEGDLGTLRFRVIGRGGEATLKLADAKLLNVEHEGVKPQVNATEVRVAVSSEPMVYRDAAGNAIRGLILADEDAKVDFNDFLFLVRYFGTRESETNYDVRADLNGDGLVNFADFLIFSADFNKVAVDAPSALRVSKPTTSAGINTGAGIGLKVDGVVRMGQDLVVQVNVSDVSALSGWGVNIGFDADRYEFVEALASEGNLLSASGAETPVFLVHQEAGRVSLANAIAGAGSASGTGTLAQLVFRPKGEFDDARFEIFEGVLFDPNQLANPTAGTLLEVRPVPAEFALGQNYPNPFNPETTIAYDLAAEGEVRLEIYNVMGQVVRTLVSEVQPAGRYRVRWAGEDASGRQVASGVFFYRLQAGDFQGVKKLLLLK